MAGSGRTLADWIWMFIGVAGLACIGLAVWMFIPKSNSPEEFAARVEEHFRAGDEFLEAGETDRAIEELTAAEKLVRGRNPVVQNRLGEALRAKGQGDEAAQRWFTALSMAPLFAAPYLNLAAWFEEREDVVAAAGFYRTARALHLETVPEGLPEKLAETTAKAEPIRLARDAAARKDFLANPANVNALNAMVLIRLAGIRVAEDATPASAIREALTAVGTDIPEFDALLARQATAAKDRPESVVDRAGLALLLLIADDPRAGTVAREAFGVSGTDPAAQYAVSLADLFAGTKDLARMEEAAKRTSGNPVLWLALGAASIRSGQRELAMVALRNVLRLQPRLAAYPAIPEVYRLHALVLTGEDERQNREHFQEAYRRFFE